MNYYVIIFQMIYKNLKIFSTYEIFFLSMPSLSPSKKKMLPCTFYHKLNIIRKVILQRATNNLKIRSDNFSHKLVYSTK